MSLPPSLTALIVDPHSGMRSSLHNMLNLCGITKIAHAVSSSTAIRTLRNKSYDLIICEYSLGEGQDGQQLLEDLRSNKLIPLWTIFIIVTAERVYERVVSAAELAPNDYILKPFTADALLDRIARTLEKRAAFLPAYELMERGHLKEAIKVCKLDEEICRKYAVDFMRLRAELHVILGEAAEAERIYQDVLKTKTVAWARLGLAKTLFMQDRFGEAETLLVALVEENSRYMDAYDWLAKTYEAIGQLLKAKEVLAEATAISPHTVHRLRKLGDVALETGDIETAEGSFQKVVAKAKYSEFRDPEDHVRLVRALVKRGDTARAGMAIRDMEKALSHIDKTPACRALSAALVHAELGMYEQAMQELNAAVATCRDVNGISNELKMELARNCLEHNLDDGASEVMRDVISNVADDAAFAKAMSVFERAGRKELAEAVAKESRRQVLELVSGGVEKARRGDFKGAVELMTAAVRKLPKNPQVVFNAAVAVLKYLENVGWDSHLGDRAREYIESARRLDPNNPRLVPLPELYQSILKKYGIKTVSAI